MRLPKAGENMISIRAANAERIDKTFVALVVPRECIKAGAGENATRDAANTTRKLNIRHGARQFFHDFDD
jgi:hypothetical protein